MSDLEKCAICGKFTLDDTFVRRGIDEVDAGMPVYWANKQFNPELDKNIVFCCAEHSLAWHEQKKLNPTP
jgi:hypothetical protein